VLNKDGIPHNPMINSGAIMTVSLIRSGDEQASRFEHILDFFQRLAARRGEVGFSNSIYLSERATADRNFCLSQLRARPPRPPPPPLTPAPRRLHDAGGRRLPEGHASGERRAALPAAAVGSALSG
jgi:hypothetical protein